MGQTQVELIFNLAHLLTWAQSYFTPDVFRRKVSQFRETVRCKSDFKIVHPADIFKGHEQQ